MRPRRESAPWRRRADRASAQAGARLAAEVATLATAAARGVAAAFALYFDLVNVAEEDYRVQALRQRQRDLYPNPSSESIAEAIGQLKQHGVTREQMAALLDQLRIELVLTAHPTEAKRRTILSKLQRVGQDLRRLDQCDPLPHEHEDVLAALRAEITALWLTDQARTSKPSVTDEVRTGLYFIGEIFWEVLPRIYADLEQRWRSITRKCQARPAGSHWPRGSAAIGTATPTSPPKSPPRRCACIAAWRSSSIAKRCTMSRAASVSARAACRRRPS